MSQNGGTNCPSCRGLSTSVISSRILQSMVNVLLRADPSRIRTLSERAQADEIYRPGQSLRVRNRFPTESPTTQPMDRRFLRQGNLRRNQLCPAIQIMPNPAPTVSQEIPLDGSSCTTPPSVAATTDICSSCPNPIPDPETTQDQGWLLEDGAPPGHGFCGHW